MRTLRPLMQRARRLFLVTTMATMLAIPAGAAAAAEPSLHTGCPTTWSDGTGLVTLVYCSGTDGFTEIFERNADGSVRQLTYMGWKASSPRISPDGKLLVFEAIGISDPDPQIFIIPREGRRARLIVAGSALIHLDGEEAVQLTDVGANSEPEFSPDGDRINFVSDRLGASTIWSMDVGGGDQREMLLADID